MDSIELDKLYEEYGRLMIQLELIQSRTNEIKRLIAERLNKQAKGQSMPPVMPSTQPQ